MPRIIKDMSAHFAAVSSASSKSKNNYQKIDYKTEIEKIVGKNFENIEVGNGVILQPKAGETAKGLLAKLRGKFVPATREGEIYAGRVYKLKVRAATKDEPEAVLMMREADGKPNPKKTGGRPKGSANKDKAPETVSGIGAARAHLNGTSEQPKADVDPDAKYTDKHGKKLTGALLANAKAKDAANDTQVKDLTA